MDSIIVFGAKYLFVFVVLLFVIGWLRVGAKYKKEMLLAFAIAGIIAVILDKVGGKLYYDPRPFVAHSFKPLISHAADNGFPSEHTVFTITTAAVLVYYRRRLGIIAFLIALAVGAARVAAHVHSPIDIIGGIVIGLIAGWCGYALAKKVISGYKKNTLPDVS